MNYLKDLKVAVYLYKEMLAKEDADKAREYRIFVLAMAEKYRKDQVDIFDDVYREWEKNCSKKGGD